MKRFLNLIFIYSIFTPLFSQEVNHWETVVLAEDEWQYILPISEPNAAWRTKDFDASTWEKGQGGIGYGDDDDRTVISATLACYMRRSFTIENTDRVQKAIFNMDYDDGYIAFLNGKEISRANIDGQIPTFSQAATNLHEAAMYSGGSPIYVELDREKIQSMLQPGENVLAIQVYNDNINSSDLSAIPFLSIGVDDTQQLFNIPPSWFDPPEPIDNSFSSNLPIVVIETNGLPIVDEPRITAHMGVVFEEGKELNRISDGFNHYDGLISIEVRGSSSQSFPKKQYRFETLDDNGEDKSVELLGMPKEDDWILYAPYSDKSLIRNILSYKLARDMGHYAPRTKLCEMILNGRYMGVFVMMEKIKRDKNRVNIDKLEPNEISGDDLTGGYIIRTDRSKGDKSWISPIRPVPNGSQETEYVYEYPKSDNITPGQEAYIREYITDFEMALASQNFMDPNIGYLPFIDLPSFVDFFILNEFTRNVDAYRLSTFMHKDKNGKLKMGPIWDFNLAFGNADYCEGGSAQGWQYRRFNEVCLGDRWVNPFWWHQLMRDTTFCFAMADRWDELNNATLSTWRLNEMIDSLAAELEFAQERNFQRWPVLGNYIWPNNFVGSTYAEEIAYLKDWIRQRVVWLNGNVPNACSSPPPSAVLLYPRGELSLTPNPFQEELTIAYSLYGVRQDIELYAYDIQGKKLATLVDAVQLRGNYEIRWNGSALNANAATGGLYVFVMRLRNRERIVKKVVKF